MPIIRYMGMSIASQKMKNRKRSSATKAPSMLVSSTSMRMANSFTLVSTLCQAPSRAIGDSSVVSTNSGRLMPSMPTW